MSQIRISKLRTFLEKYHSIPIKLLRKGHYSIPLTCALALLLIIGTAINPISYADKTYAEEVKEDSSIGNNKAGSVNSAADNEAVNDEADNSDNVSGSKDATVDKADKADDSFEGFGEEGLGLSEDYANAGIMLLTTIAPSSTLTIVSPTLSTTVAPGETGYVSSNVTYSASDTTAYTLQVSYASGQTALKLNGGTTTLTGAGSKTPANMADNSWGFSWGSTSDTNSSMTYYTMPAYGTKGTNLSTGRLESGSTVASTTKKIVFAAKFGANNTNTGHYQTKVLLSLVATPRELPMGFGGIDEMQKMTSAICNSVTIGTTGSLEDTRDKSVYTVGKLSDGKCWMTQNLRIVNKAITGADSDVSANYTIPASSTSGFISDTASNAYYSGDTVYGAYYSWCAATAGTCTQATTANAVAAGSICPKGWRLPTGGPSGEFKMLHSKGASDFTTYNGKPGRWIGANSVASSGAFFPAAGEYHNSQPGVIGVDGYYWSSTVSKASYGYYLDFNSSIINPESTFFSRQYGFSVRCVAK